MACIPPRDMGSRSQSGIRTRRPSSDSLFTPDDTPQPPTTRRRSTRGVRTTLGTDTPLGQRSPTRAAYITPAHYSLPPTLPRPFTGTLEASLDAILSFGTRYAEAEHVTTALLCPVDAGTDWPVLLRGMYMASTSASPASSSSSSPREALEELLFLITRTLLPEQVAENRDLMSRLYDRKKQLAIRLVLRYDMLREWKMDAGFHPMTIQSLPPPEPPMQAPQAPIDVAEKHLHPGRRPLMPNVWATVLVAPPGGYTTFAVRERMKHHVTALDPYLLLSDEDVASWSDEMVLKMASVVLLMWQWLRRNNEMLDEMELHDWEDLDGRADECEWIMDDLKKPEWGRYGSRRGRGKDVESGNTEH